MKKILLPIDFSDLSEYSYNLAVKIAKKTGAEIDVIYIVNAPSDAYFDSNGELMPNQENFDYKTFLERKEEVAERMQKWIADKDYIASAQVKIGRIVNDVLHHVEQQHVDMIVMGVREAHGVWEFLTHSKIERLMRKSPVPILTLKCDRSDLELDDILLACDFHNPIKENLAVIKALQDVFGATLHLLKVNTKKDFETNREVLAHMRDFVDLNDLKEVKFHIYSDQTVEKGIVNFCADEHIDFLAMGTHGRDGLSYWLKGSIAETVVNHVYQPILTFKIA
ncbi:MAG: universal stress protein [Aureispira sp.]|nr:universal stress protein [Aureispira sp.]